MREVESLVIWSLVQIGRFSILLGAGKYDLSVCRHIRMHLLCSHHC
jgi:hypothetical protein